MKDETTPCGHRFYAADHCAETSCDNYYMKCVLWGTPIESHLRGHKKETSMNIAGDLEYYLDRTPTTDEISEASDWMQENPGSSLAEWVISMIKIGAL